MTRPPDDSLTPAEQAAFAALPREAGINDVDEERTVQALRARGLLGAGRAGQRTRRLVLQVAAALTLFLAGLLVGRRLGSPRSAESVAPVAASLQIQRTGTSFVRALTLVSAEAGRDPEELATAREVARRMLQTCQSLLDRERHPDAGQEKARIVWF